MVNAKLKPVMPSLREKKRYLAFEVISKNRVIEPDLVTKAVRDCSMQFLGQLGAAKAGIMVLNNKWDSSLQRGIIKVSNRHVDALKAALVFADKVGNEEVIFKSLGVSGILNKAENKYLKGG